MEAEQGATRELPLEQWSNDMRQAVDDIQKLGAALLQHHRKASEQADATAIKWALEQRMEAESRALQRTLSMLRVVLQRIESTHKLVAEAPLDEPNSLAAMQSCAAQIERTLKELQLEFSVIRHAALDLLRWESQFAKIESSQLPDQYRAAYGRLLDYTPVFRPFVEAFQQTLLRRSRVSQVAPELQELLGALTHYATSVETARAFVRSVVDPPLELVFHDSEQFAEDWQKLSAAERARVGTQLNDCCQLLLYDLPRFQSMIQQEEEGLGEGLDATWYILPVENWRVLFTMDEDPVFSELSVTLLRIVPPDQLAQAKNQVRSLLYGDFESDSGP